jgi:hypothetical protein
MLQHYAHEICSMQADGRGVDAEMQWPEEELWMHGTRLCTNLTCPLFKSSPSAYCCGSMDVVGDSEVASDSGCWP